MYVVHLFEGGCPDCGCCVRGYVCASVCVCAEGSDGFDISEDVTALPRTG